MVKMIVNLVLLEESKEIGELSKRLGFNKIWFLGKDFELVEGGNLKGLLNKIKEAKRRNLMVVVRPKTEEELKFVLEKTAADAIIGQEMINASDSVHFRRGGLDQIVCKIAAARGKKIGFSFQDILDAKNRGEIIGRMIFNIRLCQKYKVGTFLSNFSLEKEKMRGSSELEAWKKILETQKKKIGLEKD